MSSEETPLLTDVLPPPTEHELVYERFSPLYKKFIVATVAWCGMMPCMFLVFFDLRFRGLTRYQRRTSVLVWNLHPFYTSNCQGLEYHRKSCWVTLDSVVSNSFHTDDLCL
jgi:hypothetical protein